MKINILLCVFGCLTLSSCKQSDEKVDTTDFCNSMCDKYIECYPAGERSFPWTGNCEGCGIIYRTECIDRCMERAPHMLDAWVESIADCTQGTSCKEMESRDPECEEQAQSVCSTDLTPLEQMCEAYLENQYDTTPTQEDIDNCVNSDYYWQWFSQFQCYKPDTRSRVLSCFLKNLHFDYFNACSPGGELF